MRMRRKDILRHCWRICLTEHGLAIQTPLFAIEIADWEPDLYTDTLWKGFRFMWGVGWWSKGIEEGAILYGHGIERIYGRYSMYEFMTTGRRPT